MFLYDKCTRGWYLGLWHPPFFFFFELLDQWILDCKFKNLCITKNFSFSIFISLFFYVLIWRQKKLFNFFFIYIKCESYLFFFFFGEKKCESYQVVRMIGSGFVTHLFKFDLIRIRPNQIQTLDLTFLPYMTMHKWNY